MKVRDIALIGLGLAGLWYLLRRPKPAPTQPLEFKAIEEAEKAVRKLRAKTGNIALRNAIRQYELAHATIKLYTDPDIEPVISTKPSSLVAQLFPYLEQIGVQRKYEPMDVKLPI